MVKLYTARGDRLPAEPWSDYPRPGLVRERWMSLNGEWELSVSPEGRSDELRRERITVPFCPESLLSGVKEPPAPGDTLL